MKHRRLTCILLLLMSCSPAWAQSEARQWLERMLEATKTLNYEGTFIYIQGPHIEAMRIVHGNSAAGERQRLFSLSGAPREVLVSDGNVVCTLPRQSATFANGRHQRPPFPLSIPRELGRLESNYQVEMLGADRVAGMETHIIAIKPRDTWRFGYRLWLDREHAMLLRSVLLDERGYPLEQLMFTDLQIKAQIDDSAFQSTTSPPAAHTHLPNAEATAVSTSPWQIRELPAGFTKVLHNRSAAAPNRPSVEHLVFADGLATISIFLEKLHQGQAALLEGASQLGSMHAFGRALAGHQILVIGEVPAATVRRIASAVEYAPESQP